MKIFHVFDHSLPIHSGYSFRSASILREQRKRGWATQQLTTPRYNEWVPDEPDVDGLRFVRTPFPKFLRSLPTALTLVAELVWTGCYLYAAIRKEPVDVIHAHSPVLTALPALLVGKLLRVPVVYEIRAFWEDAGVDLGHHTANSLRYRVTSGLETFVCRRADRVVTICEGLRGDLISRGIPPSKVFVVGNGVDIDRFLPVSSKDKGLVKKLGVGDGLVVGFFGSFYAYEGLDLLVTAFDQIRRRIPDARLLLVGGGPEEARLKEMVRELGLSEHVLFTGRVPNMEINGYYSVADVVAFPRRSIRLTELVTPLKPLEAMALGVPVLASDIGGHRELIEDGSTGILFPPDDVASLAEAIVRLLPDKDRRLELIDAGRRSVVSSRTWESSVAVYAEPYEEITASAR